MAADTAFVINDYLRRDFRFSQLIAPCLGSHSGGCLSASLDQINRVCNDSQPTIQVAEECIKRSSRSLTNGKTRTKNTQSRLVNQSAGRISDVLVFDIGISTLQSESHIARSSTESLNSISSLPENSDFQIKAKQTPLNVSSKILFTNLENPTKEFFAYFLRKLFLETRKLLKLDRYAVGISVKSKFSFFANRYFLI